MTAFALRFNKSGAVMVEPMFADSQYHHLPREWFAVCIHCGPASLTAHPDEDSAHAADHTHTCPTPCKEQP